MNPECISICQTCPWLVQNHGLPKPKNWYSVANLRRLWSGLRTANAPGMICHSTDPQSPEYGGDLAIAPGHERECAGALTLIYRNINAIANGKPQPVQPGLTRRAIAHHVERALFGSVGLALNTPTIIGKLDDVGLPWVTDFAECQTDLENQIAAHSYELRYVEYCEDASTPGFLGQIRGVVDHERRLVKISRRVNRSQAALINIMQHELRHLAEPAWDCGCRDVFGRG